MMMMMGMMMTIWPQHNDEDDVDVTPVASATVP